VVVYYFVKRQMEIITDSSFWLLDRRHNLESIGQMLNVAPQPCNECV
jgi:hypothetical protein